MGHPFRTDNAFLQDRQLILVCCLVETVTVSSKVLKQIYECLVHKYVLNKMRDLFVRA